MLIARYVVDGRVMGLPTFTEIDHEIISMFFFPLLLI